MVFEKGHNINKKETLVQRTVSRITGKNKDNIDSNNIDKSNTIPEIEDIISNNNSNDDIPKEIPAQISSSGDNLIEKNKEKIEHKDSKYYVDKNSDIKKVTLHKIPLIKETVERFIFNNEIVREDIVKTEEIDGDLSFNK